MHLSVQHEPGWYPANATRPGWKRPRALAWCAVAGACLALLGTAARAAITVNSAAIDAPPSSPYVIDADETRATIPAALVLALANEAPFQEDRIEAEAAFSLVRESDGRAIELQAEPPGTVAMVTETFVLGGGERATARLEVSLRPAEPLDPAVPHRVVAEARFRGRDGRWTEPTSFPGPARRWIHFTNVEVDDPSLQVRLFAGNPRVERPVWLRSVDPVGGFAAELDVELHRYDLESVPQAPAPVSVTFACRLIDAATGTEVALSPDSATRRVVRDVAARNLVGGPAENRWLQRLEFAPADGVILDPLAEYRFEVAVFATELDDTPVPAVPDQAVAPARRLLALSGRLRFGEVTATVTELANDPTMAMAFDGVDHRTELAIRQGGVAAAPGRRFGDGTPVPVTYDPATGDATAIAGSQALTTTDSDVTTLAGVRFVRGVIRLEPGGATLESGGVLLPAGFGVARSQNSLRHRPSLEFRNVRLDAELRPVEPVVEFGAEGGGFHHAFVERLPLRFRTRSIFWEVGAGTFTWAQEPSGDPADPDHAVLVRQFADEELEALRPWLADPGAADRPANDAYLRRIVDESKVVVGVGAMGEALLTVELVLGAGETRTHFPEGLRLVWTGGRLRLERSVIDAGSELVAPDPVDVDYRRDCPGDCGATSGPGRMTFTPEDGVYGITRDGGLRAAGRVIPERLRWGTTELATGGSPPEGGFPYAHQTSQWFAGALHVAGMWLSGAEAPGLEPESRPEGLLASGVRADGGYERPGEPGYREGFGDYPGLNLRVGDEARTGRSVLAGIPTPDYRLKPRSKYYVRAGGVSGIHEAVEIVPSNLRMYDFDVTLDGFRLAFLDGRNVESKTGGSVHVPSPVQPPGFDLEFKELRFECRGQPSRMRLAQEGEKKALTYWRTEITPLSLKFAQPLSGTCPSVAAGFLEVGVATRFPAVTPQTLHATLGFMANGNLVTRANPLSAGLDLDSRFSLPPRIELVGPGGVPWPVTVVGRAYLNNPIPGRPSPAGTPEPYVPTPPDFRRPEQGFLTLAATLDVPWFEDVKVQLHVSSSSSATADSSLHVLDGEGWRRGGQTAFTDKFFDPDHLGFPAESSLPSGIPFTVEAYRDPNTPEFNARARKRWLGVVDFNFPLVWEPTRRRFRSDTESADLLVLGSVQRRLQSLTPGAAELTFGLDLAIPRVNAQNLAAAAKEGLTDAVSEALSAALQPAVRGALAGGLEGLDGLLAERPDELLAAGLRAAVDPVANRILAGADPATLEADLKNALLTLPDAGLGDDVRRRIGTGLAALDAALEILGTDGTRPVIGGLVRQLLRRSGVPGAAELGEQAVGGALGEALPRIEPDLAQARETLLRVRTALAGLADPGARLFAQLRGAFAGQSTEVDLATRRALDDVRAAVGQHGWSLLGDEQRRDRIRRLVSERLLACAAIPKAQYVLRQHVQDLNEALRAGLDDVFAQVNHLTREVIRGAVRQGSRELDALLAEQRSPAAGEMGPSSGGSGKLAALNIEGYAQINDESLRTLVLNGKFEFNVPDALKVQAHLRIQEYDANSPPSGCRPAGVAAAVVQIDARAECEWIGAAGTVVEVGAKFSLQDGKPIGFDGYFGLQGDIRLGPVVVTEARLMAGFGGFKAPGGQVQDWAYVGAKVRGRFNAYEAGVGLFFGRTCDVAVLRMIDPDVGTVLERAVGRNSGPMTGVYFYGEAWIPVNEVFGIPSTCLFTVRATAGAGFFGFIHDNGAATIGTKQKFGADGRLLCIFGISGEMRIVGALTTAGQPTPTTGAPSDQGLFRRADQPDTSKGSFVLYGTGEFAAELGICPFCLELSKSVGLIWSIGGPEPGLDIEF